MAFEWVLLGLFRKKLRQFKRIEKMIDCRWDLFSPGITVFDSLWEVLLITSHISVIDTTLKEDIHFWCSFLCCFLSFLRNFIDFLKGN